MASDLKISKQKLILVLKYVYNMDLTEFLNRYRIYYYLELSNDKAFDSLNIEEQAKRLGFYNKSDFLFNILNAVFIFLRDYLKLLFK